MTDRPGELLRQNPLGRFPIRSGLVLALRSFSERPVFSHVERLGRSDVGLGLAMTGDHKQSRAEHYREIAASLARLAERMQFREVRQQLFILAEHFERMAEFAERWEEIER